MSQQKISVLIIGEKYRGSLQILKKVVNSSSYSFSIDFLSETQYHIALVNTCLKYDVIISPYRFCLLHISISRIEKDTAYSPYIILATGALDCTENLITGSICDQVISDLKLFSVFDSLKENELRELKNNNKVHFEENKFKIALVDYMTYMKRGSHGELPNWRQLPLEEGYKKAAEYYNLKFYKEMKKDNLMLVKPIFPIVDYEYDSKSLKCFMLMPFSNDLTQIYNDIIKPTFIGSSIKIQRADDFFTEGSIMIDIWKRISLSDFVVADLTNRNPNVFYELGIAHTLGKPAILITQNLNDVPFDVRHNRVIVYGTNYNEIDSFVNSLLNSIEEMKISLESKNSIEKNE